MSVHAQTVELPELMAWLQATEEADADRQWELDGAAAALMAQVQARAQLPRLLAGLLRYQDNEAEGVHMPLTKATRQEMTAAGMVYPELLGRDPVLWLVTELVSAWGEGRASVRAVYEAATDCLRLTEFIANIMNVFAQHQRRKLIRAMKRGRAAAVRQGCWLGRAPFGYRLEGDRQKRLVPCPEQAWLVRRVFERYLAGVGAHRIARELAGTPGPDGGQWTAVSVLRLLHNPAYRGALAFFVNGEHVVREQAHEPLVPPEVWYRCKEIADRRSGEHRAHRLRTETLLAGLLSCAECGRPLHVKAIRSRHNGREYRYTRYQHRQGERQGSAAGERCRVRHDARAVDSRLLRAMREVAASPAAASRLVRWPDSGTDRRELETRREQLERAVQKLAQREERLLALYLDGEWSRERLDREKRAIEGELRSLRRELAETGEIGWNTHSWTDCDALNVVILGNPAGIHAYLSNSSEQIGLGSVGMTRTTTNIAPTAIPPTEHCCWHQTIIDYSYDEIYVTEVMA